MASNLGAPTNATGTYSHGPTRSSVAASGAEKLNLSKTSRFGTGCHPPRSLSEYIGTHCWDTLLGLVQEVVEMWLNFLQN
ncbi:hypothetical protein Y032_0023g789 [Ancylostoma ceylanicum]|nr:hypothetical protein Y032_0023g789 [Ancylostoma ceylanicum]